MRPAAALLVLALAGCGSEAQDAGGPGQTAAYGEWVRKQVPMGVAGGGGTVPASIAVFPPASRRDGHFCEVAVNGSRHKLLLSEGAWPRELDVKLREGPNVLDLYDSTTERSCRRSVDTREGTAFTFQPTADGYDLVQRRTE